MTDEDEQFQQVLSQDINKILQYFEKHLDDTFTMHGMTIIMLIFKAKVTLLSELQAATKQAMAADQEAKNVIDNLMRNTK